MTVIGAVVAAASFAPAALAATNRYADPAGSGTACSFVDPCGVRQAIAAAGPGDDVTVNPGLYLLTQTIDDPGSITIHGVDGHPRPRLQFSFGGQQGLLLDGSTLRHLEVEQVQPATAAVNAVWSTLDRVVVQGSDGADCAASLFASTMRNSVVLATDGSAICSVGPNATGTSSYRNVTAIATASGGVGVEAYAFGQSGNVTANLVNVIARGGPGGAGLWMRTDGLGAHATISATHTNYPNYWTSGTNAKYIDGGGNQGAAPHFVNPAARDYRQAAGSVTIAAGRNDEALNGAFDIDGDPRMIGTTTDIGADEFVVAPTATTGPASGVSSDTATLSGSVSPNGAPTTYRFEYGTTTAYGSETSATAAGSGASASAAGATVSGLSPATTYHYRVVATNAGGIARGDDQVLTTGSPTTSTSTPTSMSSMPTTTPAFAGVRLVSTRLTFARKFITVRLMCPSATAGRCTGRTTLTVRRRQSSSGPAARVRIGKADFSIAAGSQAKLRVRASRAARRLFARASRSRGSATSAARSSAGESKTTVAAVTIRHLGGRTVR